MADDVGFITLTDDDVENVLNHSKLSSNTKNVIEMSFIVLHEYARAKSKPINELENLPSAEIVRYFAVLINNS